MSKPITPREIHLGKAAVFPTAIFDAFNAEIAAQFINGRAIVRQNAVVNRLIDAGLKRYEIFDRGWLNIEACYEEAGWRVTFEKPGYNEGGEAIFTFYEK